MHSIQVILLLFSSLLFISSFWLLISKNSKQNQKNSYWSRFSLFGENVLIDPNKVEIINHKNPDELTKVSYFLFFLHLQIFHFHYSLQYIYIIDSYRNY